MFWNIFKFEVSYQFKRPINHILFLFCFFLTTLVFYFSLEYAPNLLYYYNSPGFISRLYMNLFLMIVLFTPTLTASSIQRDLEYKAEEFFYTTPIEKREFLLGRFLGSYLSIFYISFAIFLGSFIIYFFPEKYSSKIGPFILQNHFMPFLIIYVLNTFLYGMLTFSIGSLIPNRLLLSIFGVIVIILTGFSGSLVKDIKYSPFFSLLDPIGEVAAMYDMKYWTPLMYKEKWLSLENFYLYNRVVWIFISTLLFWIAYVKFSFQKATPVFFFSFLKTKKSHLEFANTTYLPQNVSFQIQDSKLFQFYTLLRSYYIQIIRDLPFLVLCSIGFIILGFSIYEVDYNYAHHIHALSYIVASEVKGSLLLSIFSISVFYAGELIHWEKKHRVDEMNDSIDLSSLLIYGTKYISILLVILTISLAGFIIGIIGQMLKGNFEIDLMIYFHILFSLEIGYYIYMILIIFFVHSILNHRLIANSVLVIFYLLFIVLIAKLRWHDYLYMPFDAPNVLYSQMNGFGHYLERYIVITAYWIFISLFLGLIGYLFYHRGKDDSFQARKKEAMKKWNLKAKSLSFLFLSMSIVLGVFIYYNTRILNKMKFPLEEEEKTANFEKKYGHYRSTIQPRVISIYSQIDLFPEKRELFVKSEMILQNRANQEISELIVNYNDDVDFNNFKIAKPGKWILEDEEYQIKIYKFDTPLASGEQATISFDSSYTKKGFPMMRFFDSIAENGTFVYMGYLLVEIGYDPNGEMSDPFERKKNGLPEKPQAPSIDDKEAQKFSLFRRDSDLVDMKFQMSTSLDQTIVAPGKLIKNWQADNRNYFLYQPEVKTDLFANIVSARYEVLRDKWNDVDLEIYYHKGHEYNINRMMESMKDSLTLFTKEIGPYPHSFLRILEFPRYRSFAQSYPGTIPYSEEMGFIQKMKEGDFDYIYFVTAHEIAHQWWGHQIIPSTSEGSNALSESLAEYYALRVIENKYGKENIGKVTKYDMDRYLRSRSEVSEPEKPWYRSTVGSVLYQKGGIVLYGLRWLVGNDLITKGIHSFFTQYKNATNPYPTTLPLVKELERSVPEQYQYYLEDSLKTVTVFDNKITSATIEKESDGNYLVTAQIELKKFRYNDKGEELNQPIQNETFEIGLLPELDSKTELEVPFAVERKVVSGNMFEVKLRSKEKPVYISFDPFHIFIDRDLRNNKVKL